VLNRGTAFTLAERQALGLTGLLPEGVSTIEGQLARVYAQYRRQPDDLAKNLYLATARPGSRSALASLIAYFGDDAAARSSAQLRVSMA
jgi:malate dehydrogenase (oxaloacetate-decarboxylating)